MLPVNFVAVLVAALVNFIIGFLMHGPVMGKTWMRLANITPTGNEKFSGMIPQMVKNYIANVVFAYVLAVVYLFATTSPLMGGSGAWNGMVCAFWIWLGFVVTTTSIEVIWMKRSPKLWLFECFSSLVAILAMGAVIGAW
ncbi:MAG: DUF1761 domain-containing protein [Patescibacteria group bacterium]